MPTRDPPRGQSVHKGGRRCGTCHTAAMSPRFLTLADVTEVLNISAAQAYALVRSGELPAIQIGKRLQWRVEATELEAYIERMYAQTRARREHEPAGVGDDPDERAGDQAAQR